MIKLRKIFLIMGFILILLPDIAGCRQNIVQTQQGQVEEATLPTPAENLDILIENISDNDPGVRLVSVRALNMYRDEAARAIPALKQTLHDPVTDVRISAIITLGNLGSKANSAVPEITELLKNDISYNARIQAARALGRIGSISAIPALANTLFEDKFDNTTDYDLAIDSSEAIAKITGEHFTEAGGQGGYTLNDRGIPLIVIDARKWWNEKGQYQKWGGEQ